MPTRFWYPFTLMAKEMESVASPFGNTSTGLFGYIVTLELVSAYPDSAPSVTLRYVSVCARFMMLKLILLASHTMRTGCRLRAAMANADCRSFVIACDARETFDWVIC